MAKTNTRSTHTREALMEATLRVAAAQGIAGVSYRRVVAEAGMSLGTASYHFDDFDDLILESFTYFVKQIAERYREVMSAVETEEDLIEAVLAVLGAMNTKDEDSVLIHTLYSEAARNPAFKKLVSDWSYEVKHQLMPVVDELTATQIELIWDGAFLQRSVFSRGLSDDELRNTIRAVLAARIVSRPAETTNPARS